MPANTHRAESARPLAEIGPDELRLWLARLAEARIAPEALVAAATALDIANDAKTTAREMADEGELPEEGWSWADEADSALSLEHGDVAIDAWLAFSDDVQAAAETLGLTESD